MVEKEPPTRIVDITFGMTDYGDLKYLSAIYELDRKAELDIRRSAIDTTHELKYKKRIDKVNTKINKKIDQYNKWNDNHEVKAVTAFILIRSADDAAFIVKRFRNNACAKFWINTGCAFHYDELKLRRKTWPTFVKAADPSNVIWQNLKYNAASRFALRVVIGLISLVLMVGSFIVIIEAKNYQTSTTSEYSGDSCGTYNITQTEAYQSAIGNSTDGT